MKERGKSGDSSTDPARGQRPNPEHAEQKNRARQVHDWATAFGASDRRAADPTSQPPTGAEGSVGPTPKQRRSLERAERLRQAREAHEWTETFRMIRYLAVGSLPRQPATGTTHARTFRLGNRAPQWCNVLYTVPDGYALPFGQDRILLALVIETALRQGSRLVTFASTREALLSLHFTDGGIHYRLLRERFARLSYLTTHIHFGSTRAEAEDGSKGEHLSLISQHDFPTQDELRAGELGERGVASLVRGGDDHSHYILLSRDFWHYLTESKNADGIVFHVPVEVAKEFRTEPLGFDIAGVVLYRATVAQRASVLDHDTLIELFGNPGRPARQTINDIRAVLRRLTTLLGAEVVTAKLRPAGHRPSRGRPSKLWELYIWPQKQSVLTWRPGA